jgi:hypothetical protein
MMGNKGSIGPGSVRASSEAPGLSAHRLDVSFAGVKEKFNIWPAALLAAFALTRWPGLMPENFSAAYAMAFCAGLYFRGRLQWTLPLGVMLVCDALLTLYYQRKNPDYDFLGATALLYMAGNYAGYAALFGLGRWLKPEMKFTGLLGGGLLGAILFYLVTNTAAWLFNPFRNPEYTRDLAGWLIALTKGTAGHAQTWEFFKSTLFSGGLFTALFVGTMKWTSASESAREKEAPETADEEGGADEEAKPEEAKV